MARYIDADELIKKIFPIGMVDDGNYTINAKAVKVAIDKTPTVDVEKERLESASFRFALLDSIKRSKIAIAEHDREVAREIFEEIEKVLNRKIARSKPHFEKLKNRDEDFLSKSGCENMGYFKGIISTCEDFQDLIDELKTKYTEVEHNG
jgi:hypothetical protein